MSGIKRWDLASLGSGFIGMKESDDGAFIRNADHAAEIDRLRAELQKAAAAALANMSLACHKERDADALRVDAMRYRWLRTDSAISAIPRVWSSDVCAYPVSPLHLECLDEAIDAAMGADA